jgi:polyisoprenoid-binding protein YceI
MPATPGGSPRSGADLLALARDGALAGHWVLDPGSSRVEFRVRHFWGAITVRGWFERFEGEADVSPDGTVTGRLVIEATSLETKNKQRDKHLRSADFFNVDKHPQVVFTVSQALADDGGRLGGTGTLEAAGVAEPVSVTADVLSASPDEVTLRSEITVDRSRFGMTWSPLRMSAMQATGSVTARFTRAPAQPG